MLVSELSPTASEVHLLQAAVGRMQSRHQPLPSGQSSTSTVNSASGSPAWLACPTRFSWMLHATELRATETVCSLSLSPARLQPLPSRVVRQSVGVSVAGRVPPRLASPASCPLRTLAARLSCTRAVSPPLPSTRPCTVRRGTRERTRRRRRTARLTASSGGRSSARCYWPPRLSLSRCWPATKRTGANGCCRPFKRPKGTRRPPTTLLRPCHRWHCRCPRRRCLLRARSPSRPLPTPRLPATPLQPRSPCRRRLPLCNRRPPSARRPIISRPPAGRSSSPPLTSSTLRPLDRPPRRVCPACTTPPAHRHTLGPVAPAVSVAEAAAAVAVAARCQTCVPLRFSLRPLLPWAALRNTAIASRDSASTGP